MREENLETKHELCALHNHPSQLNCSCLTQVECTVVWVGPFFKECIEISGAWEVLHKCNTKFSCSWTLGLRTEGKSGYSHLHISLSSYAKYFLHTKSSPDTVKLSSCNTSSFYSSKMSRTVRWTYSFQVYSPV